MAIGRTFQQAFAKALRSRELDIATKLDGGRHADAAARCSSARRATATTSLLEAFRKGASVDDVRERTSIDPWFLRGAARAGARPRRRAGRRALLQVRRHLRGRVPRAHAVLLLGLGAARRPRGRARRAPERRHPRQRAQPHRPGHRVRLLLRARRHDRPRVRPRRGDDQLQPRDGLHRLRHLRSPVLRAADARGRPRRHRDRAPGGRGRPVRRPDAAQARPRPAGGRRPDPRHERRQHRPRRGPRALRGAARAPGLPGAALRHRALGRGGPRAVRAGRLPAARAPQLRARRAGDGDRLLARRAGRLPRRATPATAAPSTSTASWRTRSRSTSTPCATARRSGSAGSCSTSRRPASTPATRPACCPRTRWATRCSTRSAPRRPASRSAWASSGS